MRRGSGAFHSGFSVGRIWSDESLSELGRPLVINGTADSFSPVVVPSRGAMWVVGFGASGWVYR